MSIPLDHSTHGAEVMTGFPFCAQDPPLPHIFCVAEELISTVLVGGAQLLHHTHPRMWAGDITEVSILLTVQSTDSSGLAFLHMGPRVQVLSTGALQSSDTLFPTQGHCICCPFPVSEWPFSQAHHVRLPSKAAPESSRMPSALSP